jgi:hypothetical protein
LNAAGLLYDAGQRAHATDCTLMPVLPVAVCAHHAAYSGWTLGPVELPKIAAQEHEPAVVNSNHATRLRAYFTAKNVVL